MGRSARATAAIPLAGALVFLGACQTPRSVYVPATSDGAKIFWIARQTLVDVGYALQQFDKQLLRAEFAGIRSAALVSLQMSRLGDGWNLDIRVRDEDGMLDHPAAIGIRDRIIQDLVRKGHDARIGPL